ncbi:MAG: M28 family peptidase [Elusimicrobia bacterium]|nr:M28 family peptidase [Elusimicrobiota bacterium]
MTWVLVGAVVLLAALWVLLTQPLLPEISRRPPVLPVDPALLRSHVEHMSRCSPRHAGAPGLEEAARYVRDQLASTGRPVEEQTFELNGRTYRNLLLSYGPRTGERVVVGAHYDGRDDTPGADDNASGVAVLLELAHSLKTVPFKTRVDLVAYTLEEINPGLWALQGSTTHAQALRKEGAAVKLMISLEMLGYYDERLGTQNYPLPFMNRFYPDRAHFLSIVGSIRETPWVYRLKPVMRRASPLPIYSMTAPRWVAGIEHSDHQSFWNAGYPAVMITDTAYLRNPHYHRPTDTPDTLDYARMAHAAAAVHAAVLSLAT